MVGVVFFGVFAMFAQWSPHHKSWMQSVRSAVVVVIVVVVWCSGVVVVMLCNYCSVVAVVVVVSCGVV